MALRSVTHERIVQCPRLGNFHYRGFCSAGNDGGAVDARAAGFQYLGLGVDQESPAAQRLVHDRPVRDRLQVGTSLDKPGRAPGVAR